MWANTCRAPSVRPCIFIRIKYTSGPPRPPTAAVDVYARPAFTERGYHPPPARQSTRSARREGERKTTSARALFVYYRCCYSPVKSEAAGWRGRRRGGDNHKYYMYTVEPCSATKRLTTREFYDFLFFFSRLSILFDDNFSLFFSFSFFSSDKISCARRFRNSNVLIIIIVTRVEQ